VLGEGVPAPSLTLPTRGREKQVQTLLCDVRGGFLVAIGALFFRHGAVLRMLTFHRISRCSPGGQPTTERPSLSSLLPEKLRHTGAGALVGSSAVGDDLPIVGQAAEVLDNF
jgi:hypothetical protein